MGQKTMATRAQSGVLLRQPTFVLRRLDAGSDVPVARSDGRREGDGDSGAQAGRAAHSDLLLLDCAGAL
ncbi:hypothetical protein ACWCXX_41220 [Streptomyces sp. NPDC001732]